MRVELNVHQDGGIYPTIIITHNGKTVSFQVANVDDGKKVMQAIKDTCIPRSNDHRFIINKISNF